MSAKPRKPRSRPGPFSHRPVSRRHRYKAPRDPRSTRPKGIATAWTRVRRLIWSSWPWAILAVYLIAAHNWWWAVAAAGVAGFCSLSKPIEFPPRYGLDHTFDVDSPEFLETMAGAVGVPFVGGNRLDLLNNGDRFYPAMLKAIREARHSVTVETYIYWAGEIGLEFAHALAGRARSGVPVKILLDAVGSASVGNEILTTLESSGCHVAWYNPIRFSTLRRLNNRTHRKSLIVDGRIGFTGGAGIADHWRGDAQDDQHWRDLQVRVEGPAVRPLQTGFAQNWLECTGELVTGPSFYPQEHPAGPLAMQTIMSSPETGASTVRVMHCLSIACAHESIYIANPYFVPDHVAIDLLREAKERGVKIRIMVAGTRNDTVLARLNSMRLYGALLEAGIEILEYNRTMMHHKTMVVDGVWATVGTTNFDNRSFAHNEESNVCFFDRDVAKEMNAVFEKDAAVCDQVDLETWRKRGLIEKSLEAVASFFQDQV